MKEKIIIKLDKRMEIEINGKNPEEDWEMEIGTNEEDATIFCENLIIGDIEIHHIMFDCSIYDDHPPTEVCIFHMEGCNVYKVTKTNDRKEIPFIIEGERIE